MVGATVGAVVAIAAALTQSVATAIAATLFFVVYQQLENKLLQPLILSRTVQLNPLVVSISILLAADLAGVLGAVLAIPVAGIVQVVARELTSTRRYRPRSHHEKEISMGKNKDIREAVEAELGYDPLLDATDIRVHSVDGAVTLNGTVPSYLQYLEAVIAAKRVSGVRHVRSHLEVWLPDGGYRDDAVLTTAANNALTLSVAVPAAVEATAKDGNVRLTGAVPYGRQALAAQDVVSGLVGVRNVNNDIEVFGAADPVQVAAGVRRALDRYALVPEDSTVTVDTDGSTVVLGGDVVTWAEHDAVVAAAWMADGVAYVRDGLLVTG
jgi:osmotically-inducible protein OsmY